MKKNNFKILILAISSSLALLACHKKLDLVPTNDLTSDQVYATPLGYKQAFAKLYGSLALTGNSGPAGSADIPSEIISDEGNSDFVRMLWYLQSLSTDEAGWTYHSNTDPIGIHQMTWSSNNQTVAGLYYRCMFLVTLVNDFIRQSSDEKLSSRGISGTDAENIKGYVSEARFLRAYMYWILMDMYANPPFATETTVIGGDLPPQISRSDLFNWLETELLDLENTLVAPGTNEFGRIDRAAAWALLSRMYLNAEVYTGTPKFTESITYSNKIINGGYTLVPNYKHLMLADNHLNTDEFIFQIQYDGTRTRNWGGTTTLTHGPAGVTSDSSGVGGTWNCIRITQQFVGKFAPEDIRGQFWTSGQTLEMTQLLDVTTAGYSSTKFRNKTRTGAPAPNMDPDRNFTDIDFPIFRLGEIYLNYAEAVLRGGAGGSNADALEYLRRLSIRARPSDPNAANVPQLTLNYIIDERGRELFWECLRRTDLIRFDMFTTSDYLWAWKGGLAGGTAVDSKYNLYPIPSTDLTANPNLEQNDGY
jgi:hypothetical protein